MWVDDLDTFMNASGSASAAQAAQDLIEDEKRFIDLANSPMWLGEEIVFVDRT